MLIGPLVMPLGSYPVRVGASTCTAAFTWPRFGSNHNICTSHASAHKPNENE
jgi:hypothetical protein